jgi:CelD/BcsL family acetyltransferase involved in cellulose biosynthesis
VRRLSVDDPRWAAFAEQHPGAGPFHHPAWAKLVATTYGFEPFALAIEREGQIVAGLPVVEVRGLTGARRWVSLPFTDDCQPLLGDGVGDEALAEALDGARRRAGVAALELRSELRAPGASACGQAVVHHLRLDPDPARLFRTFHRSQVQRNVDRAQREGVTVRRSTSIDDLAGTFYDLHLRTRHRQGVPVQPRRYFGMLWRHMYRRGLGFSLVAYAGQRPIAAAVFLAWKKRLIYKYGASDEAYWKLRPNHLLFWRAIEWASQSGYELFDWGRTDLENAGLREFKSNWGAVEQPLIYSCLGAPPARPGRGAPLALLERLIKRSPAWVCRACGELLYRYAA